LVVSKANEISISVIPVCQIERNKVKGGKRNVEYEIQNAEWFDPPRRAHHKFGMQNHECEIKFELEEKSDEEIKNKK
jgi:hypothetical protein